MTAKDGQGGNALQLPLTGPIHWELSWLRVLHLSAFNLELPVAQYESKF